MPAKRTLVASTAFALLAHLLACQNDGDATTSAAPGTSNGEDDTSPSPATTLPGADESSGTMTTTGGAASESDGGPGSSSTDATTEDGGLTDDGSTSDGRDTSTTGSSTGDTGTETGEDTSEDTSGQTMQADVSIVWSNVESQVFCFYYSGPDIIGDEALWDATDDEVTLTFPHVDLEFPETAFDPIYTGAQAPSDLVLQGVIVHEFLGAPWETTETFTGTLVDDVFTGTYLYEECDPAVPETCPGDGFCTITADFEMTLQ